MALDRFNLSPVLGDYWRSLRVYKTGKPDWSSRAILVVLPAAAATLVVLYEWRLASPSALLPAATLLAGVLFAASGQLISLRARIADSVVLSGNLRVKSIFREALSGVLVAAVTAMLDALLLALLAAIPLSSTFTPKNPQPDFQRWAAIGLTALIAAFTTLVVLMFLAAARKLYMAYLEAFEEGLALEAGSSAPRVTRTAPDDSSDDQSNDILRGHGIEPRGKTQG